jgi:ribonuclease P protein component
VVRNRIRRRLRHLLAPRLAELPHGTDVVLRVLPAAATLSRAELATALGRALDTAALA